ncbi:MAG: hypothetical protein ABF326_07265 [Arenicellales bacterium]|jgi:hypothetical protein
MLLQKLIIPISLIMASGLTSTACAFDDSSQGLDLSGWPSATQPSTNSLGTHSEFNLGEGWLNDKWSGHSSIHQTNGFKKSPANTSQWTVDIKRRLLSAAENTYLAMGLGWNDLELTETESSSGIRFVAEGRVGIYGPAYMFGQAAFSPWMSNIESTIDPFGKELEIGLAVDPLPSMSFRAGYRGYWLDSVESSADSDSSIRRQADGFYIGGGINW